MSSMGLSRVVWSIEGDRLYSFEQAAYLTQTAIPILEGYINLGLIDPIGVMLHQRDLWKVVQIQRLRRDLGLNLVGASMVLDMAHEIARLKAQLKAYRKTSL